MTSKLAWTFYFVVSCVLGALVCLILLAVEHPGNKGPHITDGQTTVALVLGAICGGLVPAATWMWRRWPRR